MAVKPRKYIQVGGRTTEFTLVDCPTMDDRLEDLKSSGRLKQERKTDFIRFFYTVKSQHDKDNEFVYSNYTMHWKTSKGDLVRIRLLETKRKNEYTVALDIGKGKKRKEECLQTGRSGIEGLVAALVMMKELLNNLFKGERLLVYGADKRRYNVYKRYLLPIGFVEVYDGAGKHLVYEKK